MVAAGLEQPFAEADALIRGEQVELVDFALAGPLSARRAERRVADDTARNLKDEEPARLDRCAPPVRRAAADNALQVQMRDDAAIGPIPAFAKNLAERPRIGGHPGPYLTL